MIIYLINVRNDNNDKNKEKDLASFCSENSNMIHIILSRFFVNFDYFILRYRSELPKREHLDCFGCWGA